MPRGRRLGNLASLERQLSDLDSRRRAIIAAIKAAVDHMVHGSGTSGSSAGAGPAGFSAGSAGRAKRKVSPEVRERLSKLARERWAKAKKAGKTRLG
jgi:3-oxoacyl-ACP reductase-like protein